jgi:hypothetical protein
MMHIPAHKQVSTQRHPEIIPGTLKFWSESPSGVELYEWQERYPDGAIRSFRETWHTATGVSGTTYGGIRVIDITEGAPA